MDDGNLTNRIRGLCDDLEQIVQHAEEEELPTTATESVKVLNEIYDAIQSLFKAIAEATEINAEKDHWERAVMSFLKIPSRRSKIADAFVLTSDWIERMAMASQAEENRPLSIEAKKRIRHLCIRGFLLYDERQKEYLNLVRGPLSELYSTYKNICVRLLGTVDRDSPVTIEHLQTRQAEVKSEAIAFATAFKEITGQILEVKNWDTIYLAAQLGQAFDSSAHAFMPAPGPVLKQWVRQWLRFPQDPWETLSEQDIDCLGSFVRLDEKLMEQAVQILTPPILDVCVRYEQKHQRTLGALQQHPLVNVEESIKINAQIELDRKAMLTDCIKILGLDINEIKPVGLLTENWNIYLARGLPSNNFIYTFTVWFLLQARVKNIHDNLTSLEQEIARGIRIEQLCDKYEPILEKAAQLPASTAEQKRAAFAFRKQTIDNFRRDWTEKMKVEEQAMEQESKWLLPSYLLPEVNERFRRIRGSMVALGKQNKEKVTVPLGDLERSRAPTIALENDQQKNKPLRWKM